MAARHACPACGRPLAPVVASPDSAPWLCHPCGRGWFAAEIANPGSWDPATGFHRRSTWPSVRAAIADETRAAARRGTSTVDEHLPLLTDRQLAAAAARLAAAATAEAAALGDKVRGEQRRRAGT